MNKTNILGYWVDSGSIDYCVEDIFRFLKVPSNSNYASKWLACINPHSYVVAEGDSLFKSALKNADWLVPDGVGMIIASGILKKRINQRVTGSDIFSTLLKRMNQDGHMSVFFLGGAEDSLATICAKMAKDFPNIKIAGTYSPPFKTVFSAKENQNMIDAVNASRADVLWVGLTAPKQEKWIYQNKQHLDVKFVGAVGAVFDFYIGKVKRSHPFFQRLGLEWLPRLLQEPKRLWPRVFVSGPIFIWHVLVEKTIKGKSIS